jgi:hypothetical protein
VIGYILFLHGNAVAFEFCRCRNGIVSYDHVGYHPEGKALSAGIVLQYVVLQSLFAQEDVRLLDFTEGEGEHKRFFSTGGQVCAKTYFFRRTVKNAMFIGLHFTLNNFVEAIGGILNLVALKSHVRKLIRRAA